MNLAGVVSYPPKMSRSSMAQLCNAEVTSKSVYDYCGELDPGQMPKLFIKRKSRFAQSCWLAIKSVKLANLVR